jgi:uncharacterized protein DUF559
VTFPSLNMGTRLFPPPLWGRVRVGGRAMRKTLRPLARSAYDAARAAALAAQGFTVMRFNDEDVYENLDGVLETIYIRILELRPRTEDPSI